MMRKLGRRHISPRGLGEGEFSVPADPAILRGGAGKCWIGCAPDRVIPAIRAAVSDQTHPKIPA